MHNSADPERCPVRPCSLVHQSVHQLSSADCLDAHLDAHSGRGADEESAKAMPGQIDHGRLGYARVSTRGQALEVQLAALAAATVAPANVFAEKKSGKAGPCQAAVGCAIPLAPRGHPGGEQAGPDGSRHAGDHGDRVVAAGPRGEAGDPVRAAGRGLRPERHGQNLLRHSRRVRRDGTRDDDRADQGRARPGGGRGKAPAASAQ